MQVLTDAEIEEVAGGVIPVAAWKIGAWAAGAVFGAGIVVGVRSLVK
jgi:lactobin A/cerein 7B family class IIb bacteriocin